MLAEAQVDSALDGILLVDRHGEKIFQNQRHRELWKIPPHISEDYSEQLKFFIKHTKHPDEFLKKVSYLYSHTDEVVRDEVELVDGTILDRYSSPVHDKAENIMEESGFFATSPSVGSRKNNFASPKKCLNLTQHNYENK